MKEKLNMKKSKIFDFNTSSEMNRDSLWAELIMYCRQLVHFNKPIEVSEVTRKRTPTQNDALHLYFEMIADQFNDLGLSFEFKNILGYSVSLMWTKQLVKDYIWKPIQKFLFETDSTTEINTQQINDIILVLQKHFAEIGCDVEFPSMQTFLNSQDSNKLI